MPTAIKARRTTRKPAVRRAAAPRRTAVRTVRTRSVQVPRSGVGPAISGIGSFLGSTAGGLIGGPGGAALGRTLGSGAASLLRHITGMGDYKVTSNSLINQSPEDALPAFGTTGTGVRIRHREYLADIVSSGTAGGFKIDKFVVQPAFTWPWMSTVAQQYQEYRLRGVVYEFKSTSADALNSTNTALGTVGICTQYNVTTPDPTTKSQCDQLEFISSCKPSATMLHPIECARGDSMMSVLSTRNAPQASGTDLRLYDFANTYVYSSGLQGTSVNVGELWVSYDVELLKPQLGGAADTADMYVLGAGVTTAAYFGSTLPTATVSSDLGTKLTNTTIQFPSTFTGNIVVNYYVNGSAAACTSPTVTPSAGATVWNIYNTTGTAFSGNVIGPGGATLSLLQSTYAFQISGGGTLTFSGGGLPTGATFGNLLIATMPSSLRASAT